MARTNSALMMSMGVVNMWGFSPAYDVCSGLSERYQDESSTYAMAISNIDNKQEKVSSQPINVLLAGPGDVRHILATISRRSRWQPSLKNRPVHIYIFETAIETLSRDLLLIQIALDTNLPLRQRSNLFLEIFGNTCVQKKTCAYIEDQAKLLIDFVYNDRGPLAGLVDLSHLKMRTHDELIDSFRSWFQSVKFDVNSLRDHRLRHYYETRFDYRDNLIDWDYTMKLRKIENGSLIHIRQYRDWRNTGVAFEFGDQTYTMPNRTMAAYIEAKKRHHGSVLCRGLWTDIIMSPYISFGVYCEKPNRFVEQLFEVHNKGTGVEQNRHNTVEVAVYNILSYLYEIETGKMYQMEKEHDIFSGIGGAENTQAGTTSSDEDISRVEELDEEVNLSKDNFKKHCGQESGERCPKSMKKMLQGVKVVPLSGNLDELFTKKRYADFFEYVFISSHLCHSLQPSEDAQKQATATISNTLRTGATVDIESSTFMLPLNAEQKALYVTKVQTWTASHSLQPMFGCKTDPSCEDMNLINNSVLRFSYQASGSCSSERS
ncbi:Dynein assembly factor 3, C-terminal domain [Plasmopara halstedii]|uniref:Dynein assembly factor 3, C-terminal domain n=1 Tax=Plasmopara halstedii TaxID=4781 RepID=A0A0P1AZI3_PLAHL|nr:Dynein assembly factor 3, C-terminal domain [Plasmopara halstedii]CEG46319.1 Dynein assembly factor 3, C-terminal domain [Plasmopara halstedii]|eukprot:XP_024582688.1 Dynein assembly factor 3, C-terminal domain [Plasmopara halstedii]